MSSFLQRNSGINILVSSREVNSLRKLIEKGTDSRCVKHVVLADFQTRSMYDYIEIRSYEEKQILVESNFMNMEKILNDESNVENDDLDEDELRKTEFKYGNATSYVMKSSRKSFSMWTS